MRYLRLLPAAACGWLISTTASADWSGKGEFGGVLARGNTETETVSANLDVKNERERWTHKAGASMLRTVNDGIAAANRWELRGETEYSLSERSFLFGSLRYEDDAILRGALEFEHKLTGTTLVYNRLLVESGSDNTFMQNQLGLEVKMNAALALGLGYAVRHNTDVLPGTKQTDQVLTANLVYGF